MYISTHIYYNWDSDSESTGSGTSLVEPGTTHLVLVPLSNLVGYVPRLAPDSVRSAASASTLVARVPPPPMRAYAAAATLLAPAPLPPVHAYAAAPALYARVLLPPVCAYAAAPALLAPTPLPPVLALSNPNSACAYPLRHDDFTSLAARSLPSRAQVRRLITAFVRSVRAAVAELLAVRVPRPVVLTRKIAAVTLHSRRATCFGSSLATFLPDRVRLTGRAAVRADVRARPGRACCLDGARTWPSSHTYVAHVDARGIHVRAARAGPARHFGEIDARLR